ncbi:hypothetical protein MPTK1_1g17810 [Marchantia polymorpha subsp. ruderalis]|uniref:Kinesin motor domain-containing protein n=2 Tax=Marchantia polymorpha TaxID=3197 RepID=A0AAF6ARB9_MARPO|nr:hypothetical protein MARPO_0001s0120 [Marchantia polymorpha]BBM98989.1 hypothetical protein Mp_1g17810 [Marchantia polymorpha subsp. ruderalis]|eukprot:PTQ50064.1 hypothetical protein MARPO_0001s0120 [Marchantia polymorpha]
MASMEQDKKEKVYVIIRVRPLSREEATARSPWKLSSKCIASNKTCRPSVPSHSYTFDRIYGTKPPTLDIYNAHIKDIIMTTMSGINGTVIAYGQSRSGKTFTLRGSSEEVGILMLAVQDIFQIVQEASSREFLIRMSYLEVANNELNDLLASKSHKLDVREDSELGVVITGSREEIVNKPEQVISLLDFAEARRSAESTNTSYGLSHSVFRLVIESSSLEQQKNSFDAHERDGYQISVLNLVEVAAEKSNLGKNENSSQVGVQPDKCLAALHSVVSKLSEGASIEGNSVPYAESKLTQILRPSLGGSARTCVICNISPAMVHMDATIASLEFASKTTKLLNCFKVNQVCTDKALLKRQRREIMDLRSKLKELRFPDLEEEILNRRNALLMIELEREQMSLELFERTPSSSQGENKEHDQEPRGENIPFEGESGFEKCFDMPMGEFNDSLQKKNLADYLGYFNSAQGLHELDLDLQMNCTGLCLGPSVGTKRKRRSYTTAVADKVDLLFQSKVAREVSWMKSEGLAERQKLTELQAFIAQENNEQQELLTQGDENCRTLQRRVAELEADKASLEKRLNEQEVSHTKAMEALKYELALEKSRHKMVTVAEKGVKDADKIHTSNGLEGQHESFHERRRGLEENAVKQNTETQSCTSQEVEDQQRLSKEKEGQTTPTKRKASKANKVFQKFQSFQGRSELSNVRKELAVANETITVLEDERNSLWKDLNQMKSKFKEILGKLEADNFEEDSRGDHKFHQQMAAAVDTLKAEVESTASITDGLLALLSESFQILGADLKSFQEGVAEIKVLNGAQADVSESLEYAKLQLSALRHGKLASDKEVFSMKSELAKLECVVERQSGVLKVLSDNENLLNELASVRAAMKEAAGASELQMSSIQQECDSRLKELESDYKHWRQEYLQLEEEQTKLQDKFSTAEAEVMRLTQALDEKSKQDKRPAKNIKARLAEAEAELVLLNGQLKEKLLFEEDQRKVEEELADSKAEVEKLKKEVEERTRLEKEHNQALSKLAKLEFEVARLTAANEENKVLDLEQKNLQLKLESEIANLNKLLEEKSGVEEQQKKIQADLATLQEKIENLTREVEQKDILEKKQCELVSRLEVSENEVRRLTELLDFSKEHSEVYLGEMLERFRISEAEVVTFNESLQREIEERRRLQEVHCKDVSNIEKLEAETRRLSESLQQVLVEREGLEEERLKHVDVISRMQTEIEGMSQSVTAITEAKEFLDKEKKQALAALGTTEAELKSLAEGLHRESGLREKLEKELTGSHDENLSLQADVEKVTETLRIAMEEKDMLEKDHQMNLETIAISETKVHRLSASLQQVLEEKISLEEELKKGLVEVSSSEERVKELTQRLEREKEKSKKLEEELEKGFDDHTNSESRVTRLVRSLDEEMEEKEQLEIRLEACTSKLVSAEGDVATLTQSLTKVLQEKVALEKQHTETLETCTRLKLEVARLSESMKREAESREKFERAVSGEFGECARLTPSKTRKVKERKCSQMDRDAAAERTASLQIELDELRESLVEEIETRKQLERDHAHVLEQLGVSKAEAASLTESLTKGAEESRSLMTDHSHILSRLATSNSEIASLSDMLEDKPRLEEELQNFQLILASSEAEIVRLNEELIVKGRLESEHRRTQRELAAAEEEIKKLQDEKSRLENLERDVLVRSTTPDTEWLRSSDVTERTRLAEELQVVRSELAETKAELAIVRTALSKKLGLEEAQIKTQMELVDKQGECEKLMKEVRINRKMVKEQKRLLRKLTSTQSEVSKLKTAIVGKSEEQTKDTHECDRAAAEATGPVGTPGVGTKLDSELSRMREKLASTEIEVRRLTNLLQEKEKLEGNSINVQLELVRAENEIQRLAAALEETSSLNELWKVFQLTRSDGAVSAPRNLSLDDFLTEMLEREKKFKEQEMELQTKVAAFEEKKFNVLDMSKNWGRDYKCADCEVFQTLLEKIRKERDGFKEMCTAAEIKLKTSQEELENQKKAFEVAERNWKTKAQKNEKDLADLRTKVTKMEEGTGWIVREKKALEERLSCSESQIATLREAARATNKEMEMTHHKLHLLTTQHQSDVAAFCNELSMKTTRIAELEKEVKSFLSHPPPPAPAMPNDFSSYLNSPFRPPQWPYPPLQPPQQQAHHHDPHWGAGSNKGPLR